MAQPPQHWMRQQIEHPNGQPLLAVLPEHQQAGLAAEGNYHELIAHAIEHRPSFAHSNIALGAEQKLIATAGTMQVMDSDIKIETSCVDGAGVGLKRGCAGQYLCMNTYTGPGNVTLAFDLPGDMLPFGVTPEKGWVLAAEAFIAGTPNLEVAGKFPGAGVCLCGGVTGNWICLTHVRAKEGKGMFFVGSYGQVQRIEVAKDQTLFIHRGMFLAASEDITIGVAIPGPGDLKVCCCSGEWLVLKVTGPGIIYVRNRDPWLMTEKLYPPRIDWVKVAQITYKVLKFILENASKK